MNTQFREWMMGARKPSPREAGQVIILVALAAVVLVAIAGLAIDGGRLLLLRRDAQNASDASMLAATLALCSGGTPTQIEEAGARAALQNGFTNGVDATVVDINPHPDEDDVPANTCSDCAVIVTINRTIDPYFIQIVYGGDMAVTTRAIGTCNVDTINVAPNTVDSNGDGIPDMARPPIGALWAGGPSCEAAIQSSDSVIVGNWHSNGSVKFKPSNQSAGANCDTPPSPPLQGGWVFGNVSYSDNGGDSGYDDDKSRDCDFGDYENGGAEEEVVCGADCETEEEDEEEEDDDKDPQQVPEYMTNPPSPGVPEVIWPDEANYNIADFRPFKADGVTYGTVRAAVGEANYHVITECDDPFSQYVGPGVYYSACTDMQLKKNTAVPNPLVMTLVTEGQVKLNITVPYSGYYPTTAAPQHRLAILANGNNASLSCIRNDIHFTSTNAVFNGVIFAPRGEAMFSTSSSTGTNACVVGYAVNFSTSGALVRCDPGDSDTRGSVSVIQ